MAGPADATTRRRLRSRQLDERRRARDPPHRLDEGGGRRDQLAGAKVEPATRRAHDGGAVTRGRPDLVLERESRAIRARGERGMGDGDRLVQDDLAQVLELVLSHDGSDRETPELARRKAVLGEKRHSYVRGEVEVRRVREVPVEVHRPPAGEELAGVAFRAGRRLPHGRGATLSSGWTGSPRVASRSMRTSDSA